MFAPLFAQNLPGPNGLFVPLGGAPQACGRSPARYNARMARKTAKRGRRAAQAPVVIMGDIGLLTRQELAEFIDPVELAGSADEAEEFAEHDSEACADQLP